MRKKNKFPIITQEIQQIYEQEVNKEADNIPQICGFRGRACRCMNNTAGADKMPCMHCSIAKYAKDKEIEVLWEELEDVLFVEAQDFYENDEEYKGNIGLVLASDWNEFEAGTSVEAIWRWFNNHHSKGLQWLQTAVE